jgi:hypothetical protein
MHSPIQNPALEAGLCRLMIDKLVADPSHYRIALYRIRRVRLASAG